MRISHMLLLLGMTSIAVGCGSDDAPEQSKTPNSSGVSPRVYMPLDPDLADTYKQTCFGCHANASNSRAPLTGDTEAWKIRLSKGMGTLLQHTKKGFKGMPGMGSCQTCSDEEFKALIKFMAKPPKPESKSGKPADKAAEK